jgi:phospholipase C
VACAPAGTNDGLGGGATGVGLYHALAGRGALADRFFQSYAFLDDTSDSTVREPPLVPNLIYLVAARYSSPLDLVAQPLLTENLTRLQTTWAVYAGRSNLELMKVRGMPSFYDPVWTPYRSLDDGELESDIAAGQLPSVAVIVPDSDDPRRSEAPGHPPAAGIRFVSDLVDAIEGSPYADETLVLVTYLTAGGFYDHVPPPGPPDARIDAANGSRVNYGPRVPLLALGRLARANWISHVRLEMSSITAFAEWNWLHGTALKGGESTRDPRRYRDTVANNLGSLIVPGESVPSERSLILH